MRGESGHCFLPLPFTRAICGWQCPSALVLKPKLLACFVWANYLVWNEIMNRESDFHLKYLFQITTKKGANKPCCSTSFMLSLSFKAYLMKNKMSFKELSFYLIFLIFNANIYWQWNIKPDHKKFKFHCFTSRRSSHFCWKVVFYGKHTKIKSSVT